MAMVKQGRLGEGDLDVLALLHNGARGDDNGLARRASHLARAWASKTPPAVRRSRLCCWSNSMMQTATFHWISTFLEAQAAELGAATNTQLAYGRDLKDFDAFSGPSSRGF